MKKTILLVFGGESPEHAVSLTSATNIYHSIPEKFNVQCCYIDRQGRWWAVDEVGPRTDSSQPITLLPGESAISIMNNRVAIAVIFPVLHGKNGEDGTIQGLARMLHTPIVGCGVESSALCLNKALTKLILTQARIPIVPFLTLKTTDPQPSYSDLTRTLGNVLFIKPAHLGSSIGIGKVQSEQELEAALATAFSHDETVLIESGLDVREIEVAMLGPSAKPQASIAGEVTPDRAFYSYESKYDSDSTSSLSIPAVLNDDAKARIKALAKQTYQALKCDGLARIDFFIDKATGHIYVNEVNTMPGFTSISMYPKLWEASGIHQASLIEQLITDARH